MYFKYPFFSGRPTHEYVLTVWKIETNDIIAHRGRLENFLFFDCSIPFLHNYTLMAIILASNYVTELEPGKYLLRTDSLNAMICIKKNILVPRIQALCHREIRERSGDLVIWAFAV